MREFGFYNDNIGRGSASPLVAVATAIIMNLMAPIATTVAAPLLFVSRPGELIRLIDLNDDGDYLDAFEAIVFADNIPYDGSRIVGTASRVWVLTTNPAGMWVLDDKNGDGDALDFAEMQTYCLFNAEPGAQTPVPNAIVRLPTGAMIVADSANGTLISVRDTNGDGDALDFAETIVIANGLTQPVALSVRPDGIVLVAQNNASVPVRILEDRNGDGDYFDFAENLSYVESETPGADLATTTHALSFLTRPTTGTVIKIIDTNADGDALDVNERILYAENLTTPTVIARDITNNDLYVSLDDTNGNITRLRDANSDDDALDANERLVVATGLTQIKGLFIPQSTGPCQLGDTDGDGSVNTADIITFARQLIGLPSATPVCSIDMNSDGVLDGRDVQPFVEALIP